MENFFFYLTNTFVKGKAIKFDTLVLNALMHICSLQKKKGIGKVHRGRGMSNAFAGDEGGGGGGK